MIEAVINDIGIESVCTEGNGQLVCICPDCQTKRL